jgi:hypothetical protein
MEYLVSTDLLLVYYQLLLIGYQLLDHCLLLAFHLEPHHHQQTLLSLLKNDRFILNPVQTRHMSFPVLTHEKEQIGGMNNTK